MIRQGVTDHDKKDAFHGRILSKTFADLPGPQLNWEKMTQAPVPRLDGAAIQIKDQLFVFAGYGTIDLVRIFLIICKRITVYPLYCLSVLSG